MSDMLAIPRRLTVYACFVLRYTQCCRIKQSNTTMYKFSRHRSTVDSILNSCSLTCSYTTKYSRGLFGLRQVLLVLFIQTRRANTCTPARYVRDQQTGQCDHLLYLRMARKHLQPLSYDTVLQSAVCGLFSVQASSCTANLL